MAEITHEYLAQKRQAYMQQRNLIDGALIALDEIEAELFEADALTPDELKRVIGAVEIGEPQKIERVGTDSPGPTANGRN